MHVCKANMFQALLWEALDHLFVCFAHVLKCNGNYKANTLMNL